MPALVCDVNETILDLAPAGAVVDRHLGPAARHLWFSRLVHHSTVVTLLGDYQPFTALARSALASASSTLGVRVGPTAWDELGVALGRLPAHPDVAPALDRFRAAGWTVAALTNSPRTTAESALSGAGVPIDPVVSVEAVGRFKPSPEPYLHALERLGVEPGEAWMVAAHDWDLAGAARVGMRTAFVARLGAPSEAFAPPDVVVDDVGSLADRLLG